MDRWKRSQQASGLNKLEHLEVQSIFNADISNVTETG